MWKENENIKKKTPYNSVTFTQLHLRYKNTIRHYGIYATQICFSRLSMKLMCHSFVLVQHNQTSFRHTWRVYRQKSIHENHQTHTHSLTHSVRIPFSHIFIFNLVQTQRERATRVSAGFIFGRNMCAQSSEHHVAAIMTCSPCFTPHPPPHPPSLPPHITIPYPPHIWNQAPHGCCADVENSRARENSWPIFSAVGDCEYVYIFCQRELGWHVDIATTMTGATTHFRITAHIVLLNIYVFPPPRALSQLYGLYTHSRWIPELSVRRRVLAPGDPVGTTAH